MEPSSVSFIAPFSGGIVSFLSPCVLPLVPVYLSMVTGLDSAELRHGTRHHFVTVTRDTVLFVTGFGVVFVALGLSASAAGDLLLRNRIVLTRVSGVVIIVMALFLASTVIIRSPRLLVEKRLHISPSRFGPFAAPVTGIAFGLGWTPCIGPVLTGVLALAASQENSFRAGSLLATYSLGLGVPFLVAGLALGHLTGAFDWVKRRLRTITIVASAAMVRFGVLLAFDRLILVTTTLQRLFRAVGLESLVRLG